jgi:hypothetical protein
MILRVGNECIIKLMEIMKSIPEDIAQFSSEDQKIIETVEEGLMKMHVSIVEAAIRIKKEASRIVHYVAPMPMPLTRLDKMKSDINKARTKSRQAVWKQWHMNLSNQIP